MATVTQKIFTCDVCGNADDVQTWLFGFDGKRYEIDLCPKDSNGLNKVVAGYASKGRKVTARRGQQRNGHRPRASRPLQQAVKASGARAKSAGSKKEARTSRSQPRDVMAAGTTSRSEPQDVMAAPKRAAKAGRSQSQEVMAVPKRAAKASGRQQEKGIYVYGILPADIEVAGEMQGVGERPGPLEIVYSDGLAALISEVGLAERLGSPEDLRTYWEILDSTAIEVPVVPLRFGTVFTGEGSLADELLVPRHDEFATALEQLEGRAQFLIKGRYAEGALPAGREEDTRALQQAMEGISVDSVAHEPTHEREAVHVAFLVDVDQGREVERVIEDLAREWEGRIDVRLLGPMAAYDFVRTDSD